MTDTTGKNYQLCLSLSLDRFWCSQKLPIPFVLNEKTSRYSILRKFWSTLWTGFGSSAHVVGKTTSTSLRNYVIPATNFVCADFLELAASKSPEVVKGGKKLGTRAKIVRKANLEKTKGSEQWPEETNSNKIHRRNQLVVLTHFNEHFSIFMSPQKVSTNSLRHFP